MDVVIFDLNGTLVDSEYAHWMAYRDVLSRYGIDFKFEEFSEDWTQHGCDLHFTLVKHERKDLTCFINDLKHQLQNLNRLLFLHSYLLCCISKTLCWLFGWLCRSNRNILFVLLY